jgi:hypothetical protein
MVHAHALVVVVDLIHLVAILAYFGSLSFEVACWCC